MIPRLKGGAVSAHDICIVRALGHLVLICCALRAACGCSPSAVAAAPSANVFCTPYQIQKRTAVFCASVDPFIREVVV